MAFAADADAGGMDEVVEDQVAGGTGDDRLVAALAPGRCLQGGQGAIGQNHRDIFGGVHAGGGLDARSVEPLDGRVEVHPHESEQVHAQVQQRAAAQFGPEDALLVGDVVGDDGVDHFGLADDPGGNEFPADFPYGHIPRPHGFSHEYAFLTRQGQDGRSFGGVEHEALLHQAGFTGEDSVAGVFEVAGMRRGDINQLDIRVLQQIRIRAVCAFDAESAGKGLRLFQGARADGQALHVVHGGQRGGGFLGNMPRADNSYVHHVI